jgi:hypothetical protein
MLPRLSPRPITFPNEFEGDALNNCKLETPFSSFGCTGPLPKSTLPTSAASAATLGLILWWILIGLALGEAPTSLGLGNPKPKERDFIGPSPKDAFGPRRFSKFMSKD